MATGFSESGFPTRRSVVLGLLVTAIVLLPVLGCGTLFDSREYPESIWARLNGEPAGQPCVSGVRPWQDIEIPYTGPTGFCGPTITAFKELSPAAGYWVYCDPPDVESHATFTVHLMGESDVYLGQPLLSVDRNGAATWVRHPDGMFSGRQEYVHARLTPDQLDRFDEVVRRAFDDIGVPLSPTYSRRVELLSRKRPSEAGPFPTKIAGGGIIDLYYETNPKEGLSAIIEAHRVNEPGPETSRDSEEDTFTPFLPESVKGKLDANHRKRREEAETLLRAVAEFIDEIEETRQLHKGRL